MISVSMHMGLGTSNTQWPGISKAWLWVLLPICLFIIFVAIFPCWIMEDGFIMLRYARNIAYGFGVVYNPGDVPVWGCTSFLTTGLLAGLIRMGIAPELSSYILGFTTGVVLIPVVYVIERRVLKLSNFPAVVSCCILAISQIVSLSLMGFDAIVFTLMMTLIFGVSLWVVRHPNLNSTKAPLLLLSVIAILLSLTRPEGALVSVATLLLVAWLRPDCGKTRIFLLAVLPFIISMAIFYSWVLLYFGWLLPNPFYVKTGNLLIYPSAIIVFGYFAFHYLFPIMVIALWINKCERSTHRSFLYQGLPAALYVVAYFAINQLQNIELRYQIPILPILLIYFAQSIADLKPLDLQKAGNKIIFSKRTILRISVLAFIIMGFIQPAIYRGLTLPWGEFPDALRTGQALHAYQDRGYTMVVSEAGGIPFYADWHTIDAFGLNDPIIAHFGLTNEYLTVLDPEVIMFNNPKFIADSTEWAASTDPWDIMCRTLYLYATANNYTLACIYRVYLQMDGLVYYYGHHWYFVRPTFADSLAIINDLRSLNGLDYIIPTEAYFGGGAI